MLPHVPHRVRPAVLVALVGKIKSLQKSLKMKQMLRLVTDVLQLNIFNLIQVFKIRVNLAKFSFHFRCRRTVSFETHPSILLQVVINVKDPETLWYAGLIGWQ